MDEAAIVRELKYKAVRAGGAGGQHVNKVATKVVLYFDVRASGALDDAEKERITEKLANRIHGAHELQLTSDSTRSQLKNKELVTARFLKMIRAALKVPRKRRKTTPTKNAIEKRLDAKKKVSEKKAKRQPPPIDP